MAEVVQGLGIGGQTFAERELGWNRRTIRKGTEELTSGQAFIDGRSRSHPCQLKGMGSQGERI